MDEPVDILHAARHPDPQGWYARLRAGAPVQFERSTGLWIVCGPRAVVAALRHPALRVRPPSEPVPSALRGTPAGELFALLARMNDGATHAALRPPIDQALARWPDAAVDGAATQAALASARDEGADAWIHAVPAQTVARLLGVPEERLQCTVTDVQAFVRGIAPGASGIDIAAASEAALRLRSGLAAPGMGEAAVANRIALMQQAVDATAGLLGAVLARLHASPSAAAGDLATLVTAVARDDPPIHHTRRWAAQALELAGTGIPAGGALVILLAGVAPFGAGAHACPGQALALRIATAALCAVQASGKLARLAGPVRGWRPLANARIPIFAADDPGRASAPVGQLVRPL